MFFAIFLKMKQIKKNHQFSLKNCNEKRENLYIYTSIIRLVRAMATNLIIIRT